MGLKQLTRYFSQPVPIALVRGHLHYMGALFIISGALMVLVATKPAMWSGTWWLILAMFGKAALVLALKWEHAHFGMIIPFSLTSIAFATGVLWLNPAHPEVSILFVLIGAFVGMLYDTLWASIHVALISLAFGVHLWHEAANNTTIFIGITVVAVVSFLRHLKSAIDDQAGFLRHLKSTIDDQASQNRLLEVQLQLLPVLKAHGVDDVVEAAISQLVKATRSDQGMVLVVNPERNTIQPRYLAFATPVSPDEEMAWRSFEAPMNEGLAGWVVTHGKPLITGDAIHDPRGKYVPGTPEIDESLVMVPLKSQGKLYGVVRLERHGLNQYRAEDMELLELMSQHVSDALSRAALEERMSRTDALTAVYNRHYLNEWSERLKPAGRKISVIMVDCRGFKQINDRWGHLAGDRILQQVARVMKESVRSGDLVVRYGGDEFLVVMPGAGGEEAASIAAQIKSRATEWNREQPPDGPRMMLDIGTDTADDDSWRDLLERADARMYASKRAS